jgi:hypothetical protein
MPHSAENTLTVVAQLFEGLLRNDDPVYGCGSMSVAIYDTAWVSMVSKVVNGETIWLFPESFQYILDSQQEDGGWETYASTVDGILNTGASLLAMCKHCSNNYQLSHCQDDLLLRISKAKKYYSKLLYEWDVEQTSHVAFEILVPSLLELLKNEGLHFDFPGLEKLLLLREEKLARFNLNVFYSSNRISALHSLEGFVGKIDFDRIEHQKVHGSMMASPAATAAYLMFKAEWDEEA